VVQKRNALRTLVGQLEGEAQSIEKEAQAAAEQARAEAEQELQTLRQQLETKRLTVEVVLPAEALRTAAALLADGDAAPRREGGAAAAEVVNKLAAALRDTGPAGREIFVLSQLDTLVAQVAAKVAEVQIAEVQLIDGGDGRALAALSSSFPNTVAAVLATLTDLAGVDVKALLANGGGR
jgi:flotillin